MNRCRLNRLQHMLQAALCLGFFLITASAALAQQTEQEWKDYFKSLKSKAKTDPVAMHQLGVYYAMGHPQLGSSPSLHTAFSYYQKAADLNEPSAAFKVGYCYENGLGVKTNFDSAIKWYNKASELGSADAKVRLGDYHYKRSEYEAAVELYRYAAEHGVHRAQISLATCYKLGQGVQRDYVEGLKWLILAAAQGEEKAVEARENMKKIYSLTSDQVNEAEKRASEFVPR